MEPAITSPVPAVSAILVHGLTQPQVGRAGGGFSLLDGGFGLAPGLAGPELTDPVLRPPGGVAATQVAQGLLRLAGRLATAQVVVHLFGLLAGVVTTQITEVGAGSSALRPGIVGSGPGAPAPDRPERRHQVTELPFELPHRGITSHPVPATYLCPATSKRAHKGLSDAA